MASLNYSKKDIEKKIKELERESNKKCEREIRRIKDEFAEKCRELQERYDGEVAEIKKRTEADAEVKIANKLRILQNDISTEQSRKLQALEEIIVRNSKEQEKLLIELKAEYDSLKSEFERHKDLRYQERERMRIAAADAKRSALIADRQLSNCAHEYFCPSEKDIIDGQMRIAETAINSEMYETAVAVFDDMRLSYDLLAARVRKETNDWLQCFSAYCSIINQLNRRLTSFRNEPVKTCLNSQKVLNDEERDMWSSGSFNTTAERIEENFNSNMEISRIGIIPYLKTKQRTNDSNIYDDIARGRRLNDEFTGVTNCIINEQYYSDERYLIGRMMADLLHNEVGYKILKNDFRNGDRLESYEIKAQLTANDEIPDILCIILYPMREHGLTVENRCVIGGQMNSLCERSHLTRLYINNEERLRGVIREINKRQNSRIRIQITHNLDMSELLRQEESEKKVPAPQEQIRLMERKYQ